jgi:hypothetical protein
MNRISVWTSLSILLLGCSLPMLAQQSAAHAIAPPGKVRAQTMTFRAYVPFPFAVGNQTLPAGVYQVQRLMGRPAETDEIGIIVVRSIESRVYKAVVTNLVPQPLDSRSSTQLVFARRSSQRYLAELRIAGEKRHEVPNVAPESELVEFDVLECEETGA